jgi:hypothetical protein
MLGKGPAGPVNWLGACGTGEESMRGTNQITSFRLFLEEATYFIGYVFYHHLPAIIDCCSF